MVCSSIFPSLDHTINTLTEIFRIGVGGREGAFIMITFWAIESMFRVCSFKSFHLTQV